MSTVDIWTLTWGAEIGRGLLAGALLVSFALVVCLAVRHSTPVGRFTRLLVRARRSLQGAQPGDLVIAFGRVEVEGPAAERFEDGRACAIASLETEGGFASVQARALYLRTRRERVRLRGPVSIEATTASHHGRPSSRTRAHLLRERLPAASRVRVATLSVGERALVVGRAVRALANEGASYRDAPLVLAIAGGDTPIAVLGIGRIGATLAAFVVRAVAPSLILAGLVAGIAGVSFARPDLVDSLGGDDAQIPAHLALPLISPWHREDALVDVDDWLVRALQTRRGPSTLHLLEIASAMRPISPNCAREAAVAVAAPGHRSSCRDTCDAAVGRAVSSAWSAPGGLRSAAERAALWADVVTSVERAPRIIPFVLDVDSRSPLTEADAWARVALALRRDDDWDSCRRTATDARRLAVTEAFAGSPRLASLLAARAQSCSTGPDRMDALLRGIQTEGWGHDPHAWEALESLRGQPANYERGGYLEMSLWAAERALRGDRDGASSLLEPYTWARPLPRSRAEVLARLTTSEGHEHVALAR